MNRERVAYAGIPSSSVSAVKQLAIKARERIMPIIIAGAAAMLFLTIGFGFLLYRALRR